MTICDKFKYIFYLVISLRSFAHISLLLKLQNSLFDSLIFLSACLFACLLTLKLLVVACLLILKLLVVFYRNVVNS